MKEIKLTVQGKELFHCRCERTCSTEYILALVDNGCACTLQGDNLSTRYIEPWIWEAYQLDCACLSDCVIKSRVKAAAGFLSLPRTDKHHA